MKIVNKVPETIHTVEVPISRRKLPQLGQNSRAVNSWDFFLGWGAGPDDLNKLFLVDLWSIFMEYFNLLVGFRVWWQCSTNCEI